MEGESAWGSARRDGAIRLCLHVLDDYLWNSRNRGYLELRVGGWSESGRTVQGMVADEKTEGELGSKAL